MSLKKISYNIVVREEDAETLIGRLDEFVPHGDIEVYVLPSDEADLTEEERKLVEEDYPDILIEEEK